VTALTADRPAARQPLRHNLAAILRNLRQDRSLRLTDVADRLGIAPSTAPSAPGSPAWPEKASASPGGTPAATSSPP
jgi:hypothetical protein